MGLLTPAYGVSGVFCPAQTVRSGPFSPPAWDHQFAWVPRAGAPAGAWAKAGAAPKAMASMITVSSDFMEASLLFGAVYTGRAPAQSARSKMGGRTAA